MLSINLIVLICSDIEKSKNFYEILGLNFFKEQHDNSQIHYACDINGVVLELYPESTRFPVEKSVRLGINVKNLHLLKQHNNMHFKKINDRLFSVEDPDGRIVFITES